MLSTSHQKTIKKGRNVHVYKKFSIALTTMLVMAALLWKIETLPLFHFTSDIVGIITLFFAFVSGGVFVKLWLYLRKVSCDEAMAKKSELRLRSIFDQSVVAMGLVTKEGQWILVTDRLCQLAGYSREELVQLSFKDIFNPVDLGASFNFVRNVMRGGADFYMADQRIIRKGGGAVWVRLSVRDSTRHNDQPGCCIFVFEDISHAKQAEENLLISEQKYRMLFEGSCDPLMILTPPLWGISSVNSAAMALFGACDAAELVASTPWEMSPHLQSDGQSSKDKAHDLISEALREGSLFFEWEHRRLDGHVFLSKVLLTRIGDPRDAILQASVRDITEQRRVENELGFFRQKLDEERHLFQAILDNSPIGIWMLGVDKKIKFINRTFCNAVGFSEQEFVDADHYSDFLPAAISVNCIKSDLECFAQNAIHHSREWLPFVDGKEHLLDITKARLFDKDGQVVGLIGLANDITDRTQAESELKRLDFQTNILLEQHIVAQTVMIMAHDLNQPLTAAGVYSSAALCLMKADVIDTDNLIKSLQLGVAEIQRAGNVLRDLLRNAHKSKEDIEVFDINTSILEAIVTFRGDVGVDCSAILFTESNICLQVSSIKLGFKKILYNLLLNAFQAGSAMVTIYIAQVLNDVVVTVINSGPGIKEEDVNKLFTPFFTTKQDGIGMGLTLCRALAESCGGKLWHQHVDGQTAFHISIPKA